MFFLYQPGVASYGVQRGAKLMGDCMHRFFARGYQGFVLMDGFPQLSDQLGCPALVLPDAVGIAVYHEKEHQQ